MEEFDVIVIGAGPGGYSAAVRAGEVGLKTAIIEKNKIGGVCLNVGCIPTKALIHIAEQADGIKNVAGIENVTFSLNKTAMNEKLQSVSDTIVKGSDFLLKKSKVTVINGEASLKNANTVEVGGQTYQSKYIILAIGSSNKAAAKFMDNPANADKILDSTTALFLDKIPQTMTVIGGGAIGTELAYIYSCLGSSVTLLEYQPMLLPKMDEECGKTLERSFKKRKVNVITGAAITNIAVNGDKKIVTFSRKDKVETIESDEVLMAMGRQPNKLAGLENVLPDYQGGYIPTNDKMRTAAAHIYAIGDIRQGTPQLAHVAYDEARMAVEDILQNVQGIKSDFAMNTALIPFGVYTEPQVSGFGMTETAAKADYPNMKVQKMFMRANGKAIATDNADGFVKIISNEDKILGAWIVGSQATEIIHEIIAIAKQNGTVQNLADMMHAHPTICEIISETAAI
ncbi:MAG: dihydrolipoyl dehydrogenase [Spirochaetales bacterium]|nr:dihydrolipoyl dehydrogenase [Spirochaetales bacterium]